MLVVGDAEHPEVRAILSFAPERAVAISEPAAVTELPEAAVVGVVAQTTQDKETFDAVVDHCSGKYRDLLVQCTICDDAMERQREARELASRVDLMLGDPLDPLSPC